MDKLANKKIAVCSEFSEVMATFTYSPRAIPDTRSAEVHVIAVWVVYSYRYLNFFFACTPSTNTVGDNENSIWNCSGALCSICFCLKYRTEQSSKTKQ